MPLAASGRFRADWFLHFLGVDRGGGHREGGRVAIYRGDPPLDDSAFAELRRLIVQVADQVEAFDRAFWPTEEPRAPRDQTLAVLALACLRLDEIGASDGNEQLARELERVERSITWRPQELSA
jgi:hypothetical protein